MPCPTCLYYRVITDEQLTAPLEFPLLEIKLSPRNYRTFYFGGFTLIAILTIVFALILLFLGSYLLAHRNKPFLVFDPINQPGLKMILSFWGSEFLLVALACIVIAFINNDIWTIAVLTTGSFSGTFMLLTMTRFLYRK